MDSDNVKSDNRDESPFSSISRKRKNDDIEECIRTGEYSEKDGCSSFSSIFDINGKQIDRVRCKKCSKLLSSGPGSHRSSHRQGKCLEAVKEPSKRPLSKEELNLLKNELVTYIMKTGVSFHHVASDTFRSMAKTLVSIGSSDVDVDSLKLPSQEWLREQVEMKGAEIFKKIAEEISIPAKAQECCLVIDFGKKIYDFLSVFVVYVNRGTVKPELQVLPFMFMPIFRNKTTEQIVEYIVEGGERLGLSREEVISMRLVGDGASNIKKLKEHFRSYTLCSCHSVQKTAERVLCPLDVDKTSFILQERQLLKSLSESFEDCGELAAVLRRYRTKFNLKKLPVAFCRTRWLTFVNCCQDILDLFPAIELIDDNRVRKIREKIRPQIPDLITALQILKTFESPLKLFEQTAMRLHEVAPTLFSLLNNFQNQKMRAIQQRNFTLETVAKSAHIALEHYIKETISEPHLLASYLCCGMRKLHLFPDEYKRKALNLVEYEISLVDVAIPPLPTISDPLRYFHCS
ncbi:unnamed protein product [Caenorhabditis brenneri]